MQQLKDGQRLWWFSGGDTVIEITAEEECWRVLTNRVCDWYREGFGKRTI
jgi:hypothetical protein